ncbi:hypothetical protein [Moritella sp. 28]|uniref:hypothetical protein n=1 Tax=Moritella sp. 28 TaxID=2746232 RepID=UPI001BA8E163|nr:hypothetical protein [Moritella sp. 28]QUM85975.1 hypothetical protein HWV02_16395 [Moritella sp. 28]
METIINFLSSKEVVSACVFITTVFSMYFTWKFRTYGTIKAKIEMLPELTEIEATLAGAKIEGQLAKLDKLEIIEKSLEKARFDVQMERIDEILKLEKAKSEGSGSVEFKYYQRKEDSEKIMVFAEKITQANAMIKNESHKSLKKCAEMYGLVRKSDLNTSKMILRDAEPLVNLDEFSSLQNQVLIMYKLYFENYENSTKFKYCVNNWNGTVTSMISLTLSTAQEIRTAVYNETNKEIMNDKISLALINRNDKFYDILSNLDATERHLMDSLSEIIKEIRHKQI